MADCSKLVKKGRRVQPMRITCPNCNAQYEIAADMVPADGRDVQCSNCGTTWFQEGRPRTSTLRMAAQASSADDTAPPKAIPRPRRPMADEQTLSILREERAREDRLRAAEAAGGEPSDGRQRAAQEAARLSAAASVARARDTGEKAVEPVPSVEDDVADVVAQVMRDSREGAEPAEAPAAGPRVETPRAQASRRELLPDIEEINSSLRPDERAAQAAAEAAAAAGAGAAGAARRGGGGFRLGFSVVLILMTLAVLAYVYAPLIVETVPALAGVMTAYVEVVELGRARLEAGAESLLQVISPDA